MYAIMAVTPRDINFKHKLITHKIKVAPHVRVQSVDLSKIKTHHLTANTTHALHDTVESYIHMCFKYFRWSERAPQTQRGANMKSSHVCHQLHCGACVHAHVTWQYRQIIFTYTSHKQQLRGVRAFGAVERSNTRAEIHGNENMP